MVPADPGRRLGLPGGMRAHVIMRLYVAQRPEVCSHAPEYGVGASWHHGGILMP